LGLVAAGGLRGSALTDTGAVTNNPESGQAKELIDARLPGRTKVDEVLIVRSERRSGDRPRLPRAGTHSGRRGPPHRGLRGRLQSDQDLAARAAILQTGRDIAVLSLPLTAETSTERATAAITRLDDRYVPAAFAGNAARVRSGGTAAQNRDYFALIGHRLPIVIAFVLWLSFVLLTLAFRSIVVPLTAIAVNLLSVAAAYGLLVLALRWRRRRRLRLRRRRSDRGVGAGLPLLGALRALDGLPGLPAVQECYQQTGSTAEGIVHGVAYTARLITGAALIILVSSSDLPPPSSCPSSRWASGSQWRCSLTRRSCGLSSSRHSRGWSVRNWYLPRWLGWIPRVPVETAAPAVSTGADRERPRGLGVT
jgi:MMPL family